MRKYEYTVSRFFLKTTGVVFLMQLLLELSGIAQRKQGFEWVLPACGAAFGVAIVYALVLIFLNVTLRLRTNHDNK